MGQEAPQKFWDPYLFLQPLKKATSSLVYNLGCGNMVQKLLFSIKNGVGVGVRCTPQIWGCSLAHTHANFSPESCFWHATRRTQVVYKNLKSLGSTAAKIIRGFQNFLDAPKPTSPPNLVVKVVFGMLFDEPMLCTKFEVANFNGCRNK